jgi:hypothetical protein
MPLTLGSSSSSSSSDFQICITSPLPLPLPLPPSFLHLPPLLSTMNFGQAAKHLVFPPTSTEPLRLRGGSGDLKAKTYPSHDLDLKAKTYPPHHSVSGPP